MTTMWSILLRRSEPPAKAAVPPIAVTATRARSVSRDRARRRPTMATSPKGCIPKCPRQDRNRRPWESMVDRTAAQGSATANSCQSPSTPLSRRGPRAGGGPGAQVAHGPGDEDLARCGLAQDAGGDVDGDPADVVAADLDLAGVEPGPDLEVDVAELLAQGDRAGNGPSGAVEGGQEAVAGRLDQPAAPLLDQAAALVVVDLEQVPPAAGAAR